MTRIPTETGLLLLRKKLSDKVFKFFIDFSIIQYYKKTKGQRACTIIAVSFGKPFSVVVSWIGQEKSAL